MMVKEELIKIAKRNNGYLYGSLLREKNIPTVYLSRMLRDGSITKLNRGIYLLNGFVEDSFFTWQLVYSRMTFCGQSALYLNNLSNRQLDCYEAVFPYETNTPKIKGFVIHKSRKDTFCIGVCKINTPYGNKVSCYDKERCICDLFLKDSYDEEDKVYAIREYRSKYLQLDKLYDCARKLNVYEKVKNVFEVVAWD